MLGPNVFLSHESGFRNISHQTQNTANFLLVLFVALGCQLFHIKHQVQDSLVVALAHLENFVRPRLEFLRLAVKTSALF